LLKNRRSSTAGMRPSSWGHQAVQEGLERPCKPQWVIVDFSSQHVLPTEHLAAHPTHGRDAWHGDPTGVDPAQWFGHAHDVGPAGSPPNDLRFIDGMRMMGDGPTKENRVVILAQRAEINRLRRMLPWMDCVSGVPK